jgi:type IV pilus assembly protein PilB
MGIEPFLVSSAIDGVLAQRLLRVLCDRCKELYAPTEEALREAGVPLNPDGTVPKLYRAVGCSHCAKTGYRGRQAAHEVMLKSEEIERLTSERRSAEEIGRIAREQGMRTLREDGIEKVLQGLTSIEEIMRVIV